MDDDATLMVAASRVAAVCGLNPWADLNAIFEEHVLQDPLLADLDRAAGVERISEAEHASRLASAVPGLAASLSGLRAEGSQHIEDVQRLRSAADSLVRHAADRGLLTARASSELRSFAASALNTDFGTRHEEEAIGLYERTTGCTVLESNESMLVWPFGADGPLDADSPGAGPARRAPRHRSARRRPPRGTHCRALAGACGCARLRAIDRCRAALAHARGEARWWLRVLRALDPSAHEDDYMCGDSWDMVGMMSDLRIARGRRLFAQLRAAWGGAPLEDYWHGGDRWDISGLRDDIAICRRRAAGAAEGTVRDGADGVDSAPSGPRALFCLRGAVDGVTDIVVPAAPHRRDENRSTQDGSDALGDACGDEWTVERIVVEVKNRVGGFKLPPPIYDQIQTVRAALAHQHRRALARERAPTRRCATARCSAARRATWCSACARAARPLRSPSRASRSPGRRWSTGTTGTRRSCPGSTCTRPPCTSTDAARRCDSAGCAPTGRAGPTRCVGSVHISQTCCRL